MNTIQVEEESAIIPLRRLNQWKENEKIFLGMAEDKSKFYAVSRKDRWDDKETVYFIPLEHRAMMETITELENAKSEYVEYQIRTRKELSECERHIEMLGKELDRRSKKKWYQFWPATIIFIAFCLIIGSCGNIADNDPSAALNRKLSEMRSPVIVISKGKVIGEDEARSILVRDSVGTVKYLYCRCFETLQIGDTLK